MQYFKNISAKTITYSNFLGILNKIPCLSICLLFLGFFGTTTTTTKKIVAFCVNTAFVLIFFYFSDCYCPRLTSHAHIVQILLCTTQVTIVDEFTLNFKGTICIVCCNCKLNYLAFFSPHDCNINLKFEFNFQ